MIERKVLIVLICLGVLSPLLSQDRIASEWEGLFMDQFRVYVVLNLTDADIGDGRIQMYADDNMIQDDHIQEVAISGKSLSFFIPAKQTSFKGDFDDALSKLTGKFVFPDGSEHPIQMAVATSDLSPRDQYDQLRNERFDQAQWSSDLNFLYSSLEYNHPRLYAYMPEDSFKILLEDLVNEMSSGLTRRQALLSASRVTDLVRCSHTGMRMPKEYRSMTERFGNYLPLKLFFDQGKAFVVSTTGAGIPVAPGSEVVSINGRSMSSIIDTLIHLVPSEGRNHTTKYHVLNKDFAELFQILDDSEQFDIQFKIGRKLTQAVIPAVDMPNGIKNNALFIDEPDHTYTMIGETKVAIITMPSFAIRNMDVYLDRLENIFEELKARQINALILDLRDNMGGHPIFAAQLLSYLTTSDFVYFRRNKDAEEFEPLYNPMHANANAFNGQLYVFVNGGCLSTAGHLISLLREHSNAIFIGEEPGSTFRCNDMSIQFQLPNTGLELNVPTTTFETAVIETKKDVGFPIDHIVRTTLESVLSSEDVYMLAIDDILSH